MFWKRRDSVESTYGTRYRIIFDGSNGQKVFQLVYKNIDENTLDFAGVTLNKNLWYNIRVEVDLTANELKLYVNGNLQYTAGASSNMHSGTWYGETSGNYKSRLFYMPKGYSDLLYMDNVYVHFE